MITEEIRNLVHTDREIRENLRYLVSEAQKLRLERDTFIEDERRVKNLSDLYSRFHPDQVQRRKFYRRTPCECGVRYRSYEQTPGCGECPTRVTELKERDRQRKNDYRMKQKLQKAA